MVRKHHTDRCPCNPCLRKVVASIKRAAKQKVGLELRVAQLETLVETLIKHIDTWAHTVHRAYHSGGQGYFNCTMSACTTSASLVRLLEKH